MSIENDLNRIANALEKIAGRFTDFAHSPAPVVLTRAEFDAAVGASTKPGAAVEVAAPPARKAGRPARAAQPEVSAPIVATKDDAMDELRKFVTAKGQEKAKAILAKFGAGKVSDVDPSKYGELVAALKAEA